MSGDASARNAILGRVRAALGATQNGGADDDVRRDAVAARIATHQPNLVPERTRGTEDARVALFRQMLEDCDSTVAEVDDASEVPQRVASYLRDNNMPMQVKIGSDPRLAELPWEDVPTLTVATGRSFGDDAVGLSHAMAGVAETGTLALVSGPENPTTLNFLPETHVIVVRRADIYGPYEEAWERIRERYGPGTMPRTVNLISGPSRTADIEQTLINGAHGPKQLLVVIVGSPAGS